METAHRQLLINVFGNAQVTDKKHQRITITHYSNTSSLDKVLFCLFVKAWAAGGPGTLRAYFGFSRSKCEKDAKRQRQNIKAETHDATNRCDTSPRQVAATNRLVWHVKIIVAATEFCRCDLSHEFKLVWIRATYRSDKISASSLVASCVRFCDKSLRQN